jgi:plastocyanin domain-containing protein
MAEILVLLGAALAIGWVNWYFFFAARGAATAAVVGGGVQEVRIRVSGGYEPAVVRVRSGAPVRLIFERREAAGCSEEVVLPDFGIRKFLPAPGETAVEVSPERPGTYEFTCGMGMLRGKLVVEEGEAS